MLHITYYILHITLLGLFYFNINYWGNIFFGRVLALALLLLLSHGWQTILARVFGLKRRVWVTWFFAVFAGFLVLSFVSAIWVVWDRINSFNVWFVYFVSLAVTAFIREFAARRRVIFQTNGNGGAARYYLFNKNIFLRGAFLLVWCAGLILLFRSRATGVLHSPWQAISPYYIVFFGVLTLLLLFLVFSRHRVKLVLVFLLLHSVLTHLYLPATHTLPWGGDVWRHLAIENKLLSGEYHPPVLFGPEAKWTEVYKIDVPEAWLIPHKYIYGQLWGVSVVLAASFQLNLLTLNIWFMPLLWGLIMPLLLFRLGRILFGSWRAGLLLAALASIVFPWQALGALTLPVSLGYLTFIFVLTLWLQYLRDEDKSQRNIVFFFAGLMVFGYTLHFILIWLVIVSTLLAGYLARKEIKSRAVFYSLKIAGGVALVLFIPLLELATRSSRLPEVWNWFASLKSLLGQLSGWYFAAAIRPHDILSGNIIFNHTPAWAYVNSIFLGFRWPVVLFMLLIWSACLWGLVSGRVKKSPVWRAIRFLSIIIVAGYLLGWFVLTGDRSFVRRLDAGLALILLIFLVLAFYNLLKKPILRRWLKPGLAVGAIFLAWLAAFTYASGPDLRVVSQSEFDSAAYIWETADKDADSYCVLADTWELLVLEGLSAGKIVGGGFPIDYQFAQPERERLYAKLQFETDQNVLPAMRQLTGSGQCFVVMPASILDAEKEGYLTQMMGSEGKVSGDMVVWEEVPADT